MGTKTKFGENMVELKGIKRSYAVGKENVINVLKGIDLKFRESEFVSILGPSGCGKTTLLNVVGGLDSKAEGEIIIDGLSSKDFSDSDWDNYRNKRIGFVFQSYNLIPHISVVANVEMPLILAGVNKNECYERAVELLERVGLKDQINKKPMQLSGGQMQRVAIARALVADPDIILADEPTGALDNESSVQVMETLASVAKDRLVIMVTHNNQLAQDYSTRIIDLSDGRVTGDSNPYEEESAVEEVVEEEISEAEQKKKEALRKKLARMLALKRKKERKSHLKFGTAFGLSARNLISKKVRTALTSFAGSIGIIGIILVLAFSSGVSGYIKSIEEGALSIYPLTIEQTSVNITSALGMLMNKDENREEHPDTDTIYTNGVLNNVVKNIFDIINPNDLKKFKAHIDENFDDSLGYVQYSYGPKINVYVKDPNGTETDYEYMKVEPFIDVMEDTMAGLGDWLKDGSMMEMIKNYGDMLSAWGELINSRDLITSQYEIVGQGEWPRQEVYVDPVTGDRIADIVIVTDDTNSIDDYTLLLLGLKSKDDVVDAFSNQGFTAETYKVSDLIGKEYLILGGYDYYYKTEDDKWARHPSNSYDKDYLENHFSVKARVSAVIRPKKGASGASIGGIIGYDSSLTKYLIEKAETNEAVIDQKASAKDIVDGSKITNKDERMIEMGLADLTNPTAISIYANSFEDKEKIVQFIEDYNEANPKDKIKYADMLSMMMSFANTLTDVITKVLIGFSAISLIVSSIMIAVIIYTSVLERRKEVGTLRSVGARKKDITTIFMTESGILGALGGLIGVFVGWLITIPVNFVLETLVGIPNLANVEWYYAVAMVAISILLSIAAGVFPALIGAKQDPAVALRTE